ncbi:MAG TPA: 3-hydroxyacyl-CoA dehydrogenase NAD-binding domain-containing protein [Gemmatimonadota bacterium]|nr:3-hydroxyacyl-CoA dehydrogenase NAD-binding domain-containing protein [Gemmatimonadota bacterium]
MYAFDYVLDDHGIARVTFDVPGRSVNVWTRETLDELERVLEELTGHDELAGIVFASGKADSFVAGADVEMLAAVGSPDEARGLARRGQVAFQRLADLSVPTVAAIHGACMGGGLEFALACSFRVASDHDATRLAFPEVQLGIVPAWGGTQRTTRVTGLQDALDLILSSRRVSARRAERIGLVDQAVPPGRLLEIATETAVAAARGRDVPGGPGGGGLAEVLLEKNPLGRRIVLSQARKRTRERTRGRYPAPLVAIDVIEIGLREGFDAGLAAEADAVADLFENPVAGHLMWIYRQREAARRPPVEAPARPVRRLGLLGAGVMGGGIAEVAAWAGVSVRMKDVDFSRVAEGLAHAARIARAAEKRRKLTPLARRDLLNRISGTVDYTGFGRVDAVVEAIVEDLEIKRRVLAEVEREVPEAAVLATNTSSLRVDDLAVALDRPDRFGGLHFFNPVEKMPLVEVVRGTRTSEATVATLHALARELGKTPIVVADGPGFWVNRLLFPYLNEAAHLYAEGVAIEELDGALEEFGLPMGPLALLDEVGLDVAAKVGKVMEKAFPERMKPSPLLHRLENTGRLGRKSGLGFYRYEGGERKGPDESLREEIGLATASADAEATVYDDDYLVSRTLYPMVDEAARALADGVVATAGEGDLALVLGIGWPPFRGGLMRWADSVGLERIADRLAEWTTAIGSRFEPSDALLERSRWDGGFYGRPSGAPPEEQPSLHGF